MNLNFVKSPQNLSMEINKTIEYGIKSFRFIVNIGEDGIHSGVIDCQKINEKYL